jgi:hypothetical protein
MASIVKKMLKWQENCQKNSIEQTINADKKDFLYLN